MPTKKKAAVVKKKADKKVSTWIHTGNYKIPPNEWEQFIPPADTELDILQTLCETFERFKPEERERNYKFFVSKYANSTNS